MHITDIGYYPAAALHKRTRKEGISQYVLIYCVEGEGWYELNDAHLGISANQCIVLPAFIPHAYGSSQKNPWTIYWIHFKGELAGFYAEDFHLPVSIIPGEKSRIYDRISIFEDIFNALEHGYSKTNIYFANSLLYSFLGSIKYLGVFRESKNRHNSREDIVEKAISFMRENVERKVSLSELGKYLGYSNSYFITVFKKRTGFSPIDYMIQLKMQVACSLLDFTDMKINQICHKVGITDTYYFTKLFTKMTGKSPTQYRKIKKG